MRSDEEKWQNNSVSDVARTRRHGRGRLPISGNGRVPYTREVEMERKAFAHGAGKKVQIQASTTERETAATPLRQSSHGSFKNGRQLYRLKTDLMQARCTPQGQEFNSVCTQGGAMKVRVSAEIITTNQLFVAVRDRHG